MCSIIIYWFWVSQSQGNRIICIKLIMSFYALLLFLPDFVYVFSLFSFFILRSFGSFLFLLSSQLLPPHLPTALTHIQLLFCFYSEKARSSMGSDKT